MSVDRRQVNMDQEIWGTPQMFNQQTHWDFQVYNWLCSHSVALFKPCHVIPSTWIVSQVYPVFSGHLYSRL